MWPEKGDGWLLHVFQIKSMTVRSHTCVVCYRSIWFYMSFIHGLQKIKPHRKQSTLNTRSMVTCRNVKLGLDKFYGTMMFYDCIFQEKINRLLLLVCDRKSQTHFQWRIQKRLLGGNKAGNADKIVMFEKEINQTTQAIGHWKHISVHQYTIKLCEVNDLCRSQLFHWDLRPEMQVRLVLVPFSWK